MRVLWITNIPFPPICERMGWNVPPIGGWMFSTARRMTEQQGIQLSVAFPYKNGTELIVERIDNIRYFAIPYRRHNATKNYAFVREYWRCVNELVNPDIVHIHGTEYAHGNDYIQACGADKVVVSIQGLLSVCSQFYYAGIADSEARFVVTLRDLIRRTTMLDECRNFAKRGEIEIDTLRRVHHIIGRTSWDKAYSWAINPSAAYYYCGESLRDSFYQNAWRYENCEPHSIFISQAGYALKGLHMVIKALPYVLPFYPDTKVYVAGNDITNRRPWYRYTSYGRYIRMLLKENRLTHHVFFTGQLDEREMCERYLHSNLFICPSSMENSPNSLGEAQVLGVPLIASYVGGVPDMMRGDEDHLYRFEDATMMARLICDVFEKKANARPSDGLRTNALLRHAPKAITETLLHIYQTITLNE